VGHDPFLRWVGSKRWAAKSLGDRILQLRGGSPSVTYYEPFLGAGAVALALPYNVPRVLNDLCKPLAGLWWWIRKNPTLLHATISKNWKNTEEGFKQVRAAYNANQFSPSDPTPSARFLWLNHTCFNGLHRVNKAGKFNVPWGKRKTIKLPKAIELINISIMLQPAKIQVGLDFEAALAGVNAGDVAFCDPPYDDTFDGYTSFDGGPDGDAEDFQGRLARVLDEHRQRGAHILLTNSHTPRIRKLYPPSAWDMVVVSEPRSVAADGANRKRVDCLLVTSR
jgi:DNA adenine methylase